MDEPIKKNEMKSDGSYDFYKNAPGGYHLCLQNDCATAGECLRALAVRDLPEEVYSLTIVNPKLVNPEGGKACPHFRSSQMIRLAYGFKNAMGRVPHGKVGSVRSAICSYMCLRTYYYYQRGQKPLSPKMQKTIISIFKRYGLTEPIEFDRYEWAYDW